MTKIEILTHFILPIALPFIAYLLGRRKDKVQIKKMELESEKEEIDIVDRRIEFYKSEMTEMMDEIEDLKKQITELKQMVENLILNQCLGDTCPTKVELDKILAKRAARKKHLSDKK